MGSDEGWSGELQENALLGKLSRAGVADSRTFWGYVGPSEREGWVTLHTSLNDLGDKIEIARDDILHVEDVPESVLLFGAKVVWVRKDAKVNRSRAMTAQAVGPQRPSAVGGTDPGTANVAEVKEGRLRMKVRASAIQPDCSSPDCVSPCATCHDCSSVCVSICQYKPPPE